jgi:hypothetical protein
LLQALEQLAGAILGIAVLVDIFLLVLYSRANYGIISKHLTYYEWRFLVAISRHMGRWQTQFLSYSGPIILLSVLVVWAVILSVASALIVQPNLGTAIRATSGDTPNDFITALYVGGSSLSFIGASDFIPRTGPLRLFFLFTSLIGVSMVTLTVTYLMELYASLRARNALGLRVHLLTSETGDAADLIAGLGSRGSFAQGYVDLADWAKEVIQVKEAHHFYPILFYFRFQESFYSVSYASLVALDTVSLVKSALDNQEYAWLKECSPIDQLWTATFLELRTFAENFLAKADLHTPPDEATLERWQRRYTAAVERIQHAGIKTSESGLEEYLTMRAEWDRWITQLAPQFAYDLDKIDPALAKFK